MRPKAGPRNPTAAALRGGLCLVPFALANAIVANRIEPFFSFIRPGPHTSSVEYGLLIVVLGLVAAGAVIAARPLFTRDAPRGLRIYLLNGIVSAVLLTVFVVVSIALGSEIYRCDVLGMANCD